MRESEREREKRARKRDKERNRESERVEIGGETNGNEGCRKSKKSDKETK